MFLRAASPGPGASAGSFQRAAFPKQNLVIPAQAGIHRMPYQQQHRPCVATATPLRPTSASANHAKQVMLVGIFNRHLHNIPRRQCGGHVAQIDIAVNFRRIGL